MISKDYTALLSAALWPKVRKELVGEVPAGLVQDNLSVILNNTRKALLSDTQMSNLVYLPKVILPLVTRLFPQLIAQQAISVQPMQGPTGWIRILDSLVTHPDGTESNIYPWDSTAAKRSYSTPQSEVAVTLTGGSQTVSGTLTDAWSEGSVFVEYSNTAHASAQTNAVWTKIANVDKNGVVQALSNATLTTYGVVDPKTMKYVLTFSAAPTNATRLRYTKNIEKNIPFGTDQTYSTMRFSISKVAVEAKSRKLGATYSFETMEDYKQEYGQNFEDRMIDYLTTTILTELDSEIIQTLYSAATHSGTWDAQMLPTWTRGQSAWYEQIMPQINKISNTIFQNTHVHGATWLMCSPVTATVFQGMIKYESAGNSETGMNVGQVKSGTLGGMYNVLITPLCPDGKVVMGFKGGSPEETGAVYAPYVPVTLNPVYYAQGEPSIVARTRYALEVIRPEFYGVLTVNNI